MKDDELGVDYETIKTNINQRSQWWRRSTALERPCIDPNIHYEQTGNSTTMLTSARSLARSATLDLPHLLLVMIVVVVVIRAPIEFIITDVGDGNFGNSHHSRDNLGYCHHGGDFVLGDSIPGCCCRPVVDGGGLKPGSGGHRGLGLCQLVALDPDGAAKFALGILAFATVGLHICR